MSDQSRTTRDNPEIPGCRPTTANDAILADAYRTAEDFLAFPDRVYSDDQRRQVNALARDIAGRQGWQPLGKTVMVEAASHEQV